MGELKAGLAQRWAAMSAVFPEIGAGVPFEGAFIKRYAFNKFVASWASEGVLSVCFLG